MILLSCGGAHSANKCAGRAALFMPKLSVILACYNARPFIGRMLDSLVAQNFKDMEVVISDDCSPEPYDDVVEPYLKKLNIVKTSTAYNCCPGNTRQAGYDASSGDWVIFGDQDDEYVSGAFHKVFKEIEKSERDGFNFPVVTTDFIEGKYVKDNFVPIRTHSRSYGWTHGKFYRRTWWEKNHVAYKHDLKSHEDIYLSSLVTCIMDETGDQPMYVPVLTYHWIKRPDSITQGEGRLFIENHMPEYIESTGRVFLDYYKRRGEEALAISKYQAASVILYCYFYHMGSIFADARGFIRENSEVIAEYYREFKKTFGMSNDELLLYCAQDHGHYFWNIQEQAMVATGTYIPCISFPMYLSMMAPEVKQDANEDTPA